MTAYQVYWAVAGSYIALFVFILFGMPPLIRKVSCKHDLWWFVCKKCKK